MTTDYPTAASPSPVLSRLRLVLILICALIGLNVLAGEADASLKVESFSTTSSNSEAGPAIRTFRILPVERTGCERGRPERHLRAPEGIFGNPRDHPLHLGRTSRSDQLPVRLARPVLITVYSNYEGEPTNCSAPRRYSTLEPAAQQTALFAFDVPTLDIPINIPVAVRTASPTTAFDFTVQEHQPVERRSPAPT